MSDHPYPHYPRLTEDAVEPCPECGEPTFRSLTAGERGRRHVEGAFIACPS